MAADYSPCDRNQSIVIDQFFYDLATVDASVDLRAIVRENVS